jgi:hypothetical protein
MARKGKKRASETNEADGASGARTRRERLLIGAAAVVIAGGLLWAIVANIEKGERELDVAPRSRGSLAAPSSRPAR